MLTFSIILQNIINIENILPTQIIMLKKQRFDFIIGYFSEHKPQAETELTYSTPYQLIVAVILSAQCTDKRVNIITPSFFKSFPDFHSLSNARFEDVYEHIKSCSYPNNKGKNLIAMAQTVVTNFNSTLPHDLTELQKIPGVGRKTANVLASVLFDAPAIAVDTHVFRVSARLGLVSNAKTPLETEKQLIKYIPENKRAIAHHWLILHGRYICKARNPQCDICPLKPACKYFKKYFSKK